METLKNIFVPEKFEIESYTLSLNLGVKYNFAVLVTKSSPKSKLGYKVIKHYGFNNLDSAMSYIHTFIANVKKAISDKQKIKQQKKELNKDLNAADYFNLNDIIVNTWGWEQSNVNFYKVTSIGKKTIDIQEVGQITVDGSIGNSGMSCDVMPNEQVLLQSKYRLRVKKSISGQIQLSNPQNYYYMHKWDGRAQYKSSYA